jgi:catechol 2,3-dioxygenase-like lactoylglutathione lyase family enzyme
VKGVLRHDKPPCQAWIPLLALDHVAFNVPNLEEAVSFFTLTLGCSLVDRGGPVDYGDGLTVSYALLRFDETTAFELLEWRGPHVGQAMPGFSDNGGGHIAFVVADLDLALAAVAEQSEMTVSPPQDLPDGRRFARFTTPWGLTVQLLTRHPS